MSNYDRNYSQDGGHYEMSSLNASRSNDNLVSRGGQQSMEVFYDEISSIQDSIRTFNANILKISELHTRSLNSMDETAAKRIGGQLEELIDETSQLSNDLKKRIKNLERQGGSSGPEGQARATQTAFVKSKFLESIQGYQQVEREYRTKYKQRIERQFKIVKPDATPEEVKAVVESDDAQIFAQDLMNSNRLGQSRAAYQEVQNRHADIKKIEKTLIELAQLFNDMSLAVEQQDEQIEVIHHTAIDIDNNVQQGLHHTESAVKSAAGARRKRWICLWITVIVIIVIIIIVLAQIQPWRQK